MLNSTQKPVSMLQGESQQSISYDEAGNLASVSTDSYDVALTYNSHDLLTAADINANGKVSSVRYQYDNSHRKPSVIQRDDNVTFIEYNAKGLQQKATRLKVLPPLDVNAIAKSKLADIRQLDNIELSEKQFTYSQHGLLKSTINGAGEEVSFEYNAAGEKVATIKADGSRVLKSHLTPALSNVRQKLRIPEDLTVGRYVYSARSSNTQVVFVGGALDKNGSRIVQDYAIDFKPRNAATSYKTHAQIGTTWGIGKTTDPFGKTKETLIVVGHSWGGDSAVEASKQTRASKKVDLLITVDAVGTGDWNDGADHWIAIYAEPGPAFKTHFHIEWHKKGWFKYFHFHKEKHDGWSQGDWIAFAGGKGSYSTYDKGNANPDEWVTYYGSHEDFQPMIDFMEKDSRFHFGLRLYKNSQ